ncbi:MAG: Asp-tRNA(Asn)/Glu-tRNA(Gln) amidotransferase subunit GatB [Deltaproteobacteria bacterium]|nr:Asp-tRNA(Asn)/Glu-tRNA(Gln) amidotransferase subunit GatB [Deltaproteobacteria bacterium]
MEFEPVIGLEVHVQLLTKSKIFCSCSTEFGSSPNTHTCPVCLGMPGVLPVLNKEVMEFALRFGVATHSKISDFSRFARKNYFYPDLPKGYQISQYELPIIEGGFIEIDLPEGKKKIRLVRVHMEEDAGKLIHRGDISFVDFNRAGIPLLEIVSEPDLRTPQEAGKYLRKIRTLVRYLKISNGNMEEGSMRCDANISIRKRAEKKLGTKVEIKNMNSFRHVEKALSYEVKRQISLVQNGKPVVQETRLWDEKENVTKSMRSKEEAYEYRYFPEPDLVPLFVDKKWNEKVKADMPELPDEKEKRFIKDYKLSPEKAIILTESKDLADYFEDVCRIFPKPEQVVNWMLSEFLAYLNKEGKEIGDVDMKPSQVAELLKLVDEGTISGKIAKSVFGEMWETHKDARDIIQKKGLTQIKDENKITEVVCKVIEENPNVVEKYKKGKKNVVGFLAGQVMKYTKGKASPQLVNKILLERLK